MDRARPPETHFRPRGAIAVTRPVVTALTGQGVASGLWTGLDRDASEDEPVWADQQDR